MFRYLRLLAAHECPFRFLAARLLTLTRLSQWFVIDLDGYRMRFFPSDLSASLWIHGRDPDRGKELGLLKRYLRPGDTMVDVGANIGSMTVPAALVVVPDGTIYSIEPHPRIRGYLEANVRLNGLNNVVLVAAAIGDHEGEVFLTDKQCDDFNHVIDAPAPTTVRLCPLDAIPIRGNVALLKIDVEGYEKFVLGGARGILRRTRCVLYEAYDDQCVRFGYRANEVVAELSEQGFQPFQLVGWQSIAPLALDCDWPGGGGLLGLRDVDEFLARSGAQVEADHPV